ncbi:MAG: hypothetical protein DVB25_09280 [Verrucomicrobia bacterium]|nr:MAG: hypothetical protein DVB25_09280 [Verrucomicrobiota bacterium]
MPHANTRFHAIGQGCLYSGEICCAPNTEDQLVEQPAIGLFAELAWELAAPIPCAGVADVGLLGRETRGEVVLTGRLCAALERLNPALPPEAITAAVDELTRDRSAMHLLSGQVELAVSERNRHTASRS